MKRFGISDKLGYMFGDFGNDFFFSLVASYLMLFYTDVMGISGAIVGVLFLVARIWDAFMDVAWGRFIDSRKPGKSGKFKPWMMRMSFPLAIFGVLMFIKIPGMTNQFYMVYAFATYIIWGSLYSTVNIPYGSMASVITGDPTERASLSTFRSVGAAIAGTVISIIVPLVIFVDNKADSGRFASIAIVFAILAMICYSLCYFLTTERVVVQDSGEKLYWKVTLAGMKRNKPLIALISAALVLLISTMLVQAMNSYMFKDYFNNTKALSIAGFILSVTPIFLAPFIAPIIRRFGKKESASVALLISSISYLVLFLLPGKNVVPFLIVMFVGSLGVGLFNTTIWAFVTDVIDYQEYLTDTREDATIYSMYSFARKIGQAIAGGLSGVALSAIGYVEGAQFQTEQVALSIKNFSTLTPAIAYFIVFLILVFLYPLNKKKLEELTLNLKERHDRKAENIKIIEKQKDMIKNK